MPARPESADANRLCLLASALAKETRALDELASQWRLRLVTTGMGGRRTGTFLEKELSAHPPSLLIFTGVAGALSPDVGMGQVVLPESWLLKDGREVAGTPEIREKLRDHPNLLTMGTGLTVRKPVLRPRSRIRMHQETGAIICDMEAAHALKVAQAHQVPCLALKVVSDTAESSLADFWRELDANLAKLRTCLVSVLERLGIPRSVSGPAAPAK